MEHKGGKVINSKGIYNRCVLPRLIVEVGGVLDSGKDCRNGQAEEGHRTNLKMLSDKRNRDSEDNVEMNVGRKNKKRRKILVDANVEWLTTEKENCQPVSLASKSNVGGILKSTRQTKITMLPWWTVMARRLVWELVENAVDYSVSGELLGTDMEEFNRLLSDPNIKIDIEFCQVRNRN